MSRSLIPGPDERSLLVGKTGSGKSMTARILLSHISRTRQTLILDTKRTRIFRSWPGSRYSQTLDDLADDLDSGEYSRLVYQPDYDQMGDALDGLLQRLYMRARPITIYIDEILDVCDNTRAGPGLGRCIKLGRERGVCMLSATQRPVGIPRIYKTETERFYIHRLTDPEDRKVIDGFVGAKLPPAKMRRFWYYHDGEEAPPVDMHFRLLPPPAKVA